MSLLLLFCSVWYVNSAFDVFFCIYSHKILSKIPFQLYVKGGVTMTKSVSSYLMCVFCPISDRVIHGGLSTFQ